MALSAQSRQESGILIVVTQLLFPPACSHLEGVREIVSLSRSIELSSLVPSEFYLSQNYPRPFCEKTTIESCMACKTKVKPEVFSSEGRRLEALLNGEKEPNTRET